MPLRGDKEICDVSLGEYRVMRIIRPERAKAFAYLAHMLLALQAVFFCYSYTQGDALGCWLIGLTGRLSDTCGESFTHYKC